MRLIKKYYTRWDALVGIDDYLNLLTDLDEEVDIAEHFQAEDLSNHFKFKRIFIENYIKERRTYKTSYRIKDLFNDYLTGAYVDYKLSFPKQDL